MAPSFLFSGKRKDNSMSKSNLVNYTKISPNSSARTAKIDTITIHHMAGNLSVEACAAVFQDTTRQASSNYGIGTDGRIGLYVDESRRAWTSSNRDNDNRAVTIEVANDGGSPNWHVSDKALASTIDLCVDICQRNGIAKLNYTGDKSGSLTMHKWFASTLCPGPYLGSKFPYIAAEVNKRLSAGGSSSGSSNPAPEKKPESAPPVASLWCVQAGAYSHKATAEARAKKVKAAGFDFSVVQVDDLYKVQSSGCNSKTDANALLAKVKGAGFSAFITERVEEVAGKKSVDRIVQEVIWGLWGNGTIRKEKLTAAGYDYEDIQNRVNKLMGK